ncbi:MAG: M23 family metallopeptidase [Chitinophagales bacterium]
MSTKKIAEGDLKERLAHLKDDKYRMVILTDDTLEERLSFKLTKLNVIMAVSTVLLFTVFLTVSSIFFTPIREYIPGYADTNTRRKALELGHSTDSLGKVVVKQAAFIENIKGILLGETGAAELDRIQQSEIDQADSLTLSIEDLDEISDAEKRLRGDVEQKLNYDLLDGINDRQNLSSIADIYFFPPLKGYISSFFDPSKDHLGIDVVAAENEPVKAIGDGVVITSTWTVDTGHTLAIQHEHNLVSFYKHNSVLLKKVGTFVEAGDAIAIIGNSGAESTGIHLHFELWYNQTPIDPIEYINFN